ncbi:MAG: 3-dehydroquinate dehydratase, partial [Myxococcaceae bacterium]|nr:3-dehydroquinate dehydratase [Myxococcaceae bacterium]
GRVLPSGEIVKSLGGKPARPLLAKKPPAPSAPPKSMGGRRASAVPSGVISRALVRQQIADRLAGSVTASGLAAWARAEWQKLQSGAPMESGQRDKLEDVLQQLLLSATMKASDDQLIELMTQLSE